MNQPTVHVACLTPAGTGAIATIALRGANAWSLVEPLLKPRKVGGRPPQPVQAKTFWFGRLGNDLTEDVVITVRGSDEAQEIAIHCHGGPAVVRWLLDLFRERGATELNWENWLRHTACSRLQGEAAIALAHAHTLRTANSLLDQYHGALERELRDIVDGLPSRERQRRVVALDKLEQLCQRSAVGRHLTTPWQVVLAGAANVGKSSLINSILGFQRSITSPVPGTTRDVVTALTAFDGWPVELSDTAGIRDATGGLEAEGIRRAEQAWTNADLRLWIMDATAKPIFPTQPDAPRLLTVINKIDLPAAWDLNQAPEPTMRVSALTGEGVPGLIDEIAARLVSAAPPPGAAVPFTASICETIFDACRDVRAGKIDRAVSALQSVLGSPPCEETTGRVE